jgi:purine-binding chemotaxis protein CheW
MAETKSKQYIDIRLGEELYGIEIKYIDSIIVMQNITRVPKAQSFFLGVINLRGEVIPVMNLRTKLGLEEKEFTSTTRIMIVEPEPLASPVGLIVDEVNEVITLNDDDVNIMNYDENDSKAAYSAGIGKLGDNLVNILNIPELIGKED